MSKIKLSQGKFALVDDKDFEWLSKFNWHFGGRGYAVRTINHSQKEYMHRVILGQPDSLETDHKNMDRLDNRRRNLRPCTVRENQRNRGLMKTNTSGYKGVYLRKKDNKWISYITINGNKKKFIGAYLTAIEAAKAWDQKAKVIFGEFARLNTI